MNKPCSHCGGKVIPHVKKNKELLHVCVECGVIVAGEAANPKEREKIRYIGGNYDRM